MTIYKNSSEIEERITELVGDFEATLPDEILANIDFELIADVRTLLDVDSACGSDLDELIALMEFQEEVIVLSGWSERGIELIPVSHTETHFKEMLEGDGIGPFPEYLVIDWDKTVEKLLVDYKAVSLLGESYYVRVA
jgi:hypothetical protein